MCYSEDTMEIKNIPLSQIRRPLPRQTDPEKVNQLMQSIAEEGLREPIDVLEVDGNYYGFSGCHRFAAHRKFGSETPSFYDGFAVKYEHRLRNIC
ncbi:MAG: ParB N-terminal domain-containing protein [Microcystis sp. M048S1]|uniref:sulfiredoxin n=1 Tax=unclassified Microcystis TaxID=2643300 RepID=UPI0011934C32|nr:MULTISPECIES: sulfiredoxin [unclassified Microcystis]MCA2903252.1 ParB N-terminal domain-containing protein [Microcystis sp. M035S1]MCA2722123.1 ParB N-terminal domain-containing protein [Microcystis sp. M176S2]MCA2725729.1 ParB N-terminal domain-containing protein [Microcystis sp. M166S2]MCA2730352.1 ParB N-terminal domain-containing protein [Microcystis sp. M162S2]MCA2747175.1 ParB N-terminal domain-containing protein [Microcystis sp. M155S2]